MGHIDYILTPNIVKNDILTEAWQNRSPCGVDIGMKVRKRNFTNPAEQEKMHERMRNIHFGGK